MPAADEGGLRAVRAAWRMEMQPEELATVSQILAGLLAGEPAHATLRLAAGGRELIYLREFLDELASMIRKGEVQVGSYREEQLLDETCEQTRALLARLEEHLGAFPPARSSARKSGARETFLVDLSTDHQHQARWVIDLAHQASDAPEPTEPVGRMFLRAAGEDFLELAHSLDELAASLDASEFRDLVAEIGGACGRMATAISGKLPPRPEADEVAG